MDIKRENNLSLNDNFLKQNKTCFSSFTQDEMIQ